MSRDPCSFQVIRGSSWGYARAEILSSLGSRGSVIGILSSAANLLCIRHCCIFVLSAGYVLTPGSKDEIKVSLTCLMLFPEWGCLGLRTQEGS